MSCIDHLRAQKRRPEYRLADLSEQEADLLEATAVSANAIGPDDALASRELLFKLLDQLNPDDRMVIQLLDLDQNSIAEVSQLTGWNGSLVKVRAFRARRKLQKLFSELKKKEGT